ncbi:MAG: Uma2 family endonuclease [Candidatus Eremiobacteraeota bacterium]|nr:Uma2 family endonuclease [Candidatus Eremiobacteraeota bacterium]
MADSVKHDRIVLTYEDYLTLPNDRNRYEILEGELVMTPSPTTVHQKVSQNLEFIIISYLREHPVGSLYHAPVDVLLSDISVVVPDILFVAQQRASLISERGIEGAPDLIVEILSPGTAKYDRVSKMQIYGKRGVEWYWIVDHKEKTIEEYHNEKGSFRLVRKASADEDFHPGLFPGLVIPLSKVWE